METWIDRTEYPFHSNYFDLPMGRMHYVAEGTSEHALVMVHGNPAWSFTYRKLIKALSGKYRCVAPDHIGFGISDKPPDWDYLPQSHSANLEKLLQHLKLPSATLIVGDWGGPIGLSYALNHPDRISSMVVTNTWMWPVKGIWHYEIFSRLMGGFVGRTLIKRYNFFAKVLMKKMFRARIDPAIHRHYIEPLRKPADRKGCWVFPREIIASSSWLADLWRRRAVITNKPALILWGLRDIAFREVELEKWKTAFPQAEVHVFENAGHFVQEEIGEKLAPLIERHLEQITR